MLMAIGFIAPLLESPAFADSSPATAAQNPPPIESAAQAVAKPLISQANYITLPNGEGTLTSNVWRSTFATYSGNTIQWDWQVSAVYSGSKTVQMIKTQWYSVADLRNSASISMGVSGDGASAGYASSWQSISTKPKYWENTNGATESDWYSNIVIAPSADYASNTISTISTAYVKIAGDPKTYYYSASV